MGKTYFVYIMSNKSRRLYLGITSEFQARVFQHKNKWYEGSFTARYRFDMLVYFEAFSNPSEAIEREKEIKGWRRPGRLLRKRSSTLCCAGSHARAESRRSRFLRATRALKTARAPNARSE